MLCFTSRLPISIPVHTINKRFPEISMGISLHFFTRKDGVISEKRGWLSFFTISMELVIMEMLQGVYMRTGFSTGPMGLCISVSAVLALRRYSLSYLRNEKHCMIISGNI